MDKGQLVFAQVMSFFPRYEFNKCVACYQGHYRTRSFSCWDQYLSMAYGQLTYRESLRDTVTCLRSQTPQLYYAGFRSRVSRSTLADANENRDWRIYADLAQTLIAIARPLYVHEDLGLDLDNTVYALDATTIDLCLSVFPWAEFRKTKAAVKLHTLLDLRGNIPTFIHITDGKVADVNVLDVLLVEAGAFYIMDRGYIDFKRLYAMDQDKAFFVTRGKSNLRFRRLYSHKVDKSSGVKCDQTIKLTGHTSVKDYPDTLRRIKYTDEESGHTFVFLTNNTTLPALTIAKLYKARWQVELFFKWIKQHLRIKAFYGTSENAVKTQIWIAIGVYVLIAIVKKRLQLESSVYTILQILSVNLFRQVPIQQLLQDDGYKNDDQDTNNQLSLLDY